MAAAEGRAAWQRAANRCPFQEDAKRAPKLACCPSSATEQNDTNAGNAAVPEGHPLPGFTPLNWNPMNSNLPPDTKWWLQLQPNFALQTGLTCEGFAENGGETKKKAETAGLTYGKTVNIDREKIQANHEPPWMVSTAFVMHGSDMRVEDMKTATNYIHQQYKSRGNMGDYDKDQIDLKPLPKPFSDIDSPWTQDNRREPWWRIADENELALLVARRSKQHIENCDLPRPTQAIHVRRDLLSGLDALEDCGFLSSPFREKVNPGLFDHLDYGQNNYNVGSTDARSWSSLGVGRLLHDQDKLYSNANNARRRNDLSESKPRHENDQSRAQLLEALRHSQTRAREAEMAAKKAHDEKDHIVKLLFRQASHLFACKQWLKMLQLENLCLQLKIKDCQISALFPVLPWMPSNDRPPARDEKNAKPRQGKKQQKTTSGFCQCVVVFVVGLGLAGAGLLLGWTLDWLLPSL